ncbi:hypothetical protein BKA00_000447 [Actinomadura coerulea]|uniref:Uncharacterized protein n=1 Tax=Actinomadura coerulea TaxID=46159 RepID=A0A7X0FTP8_9ACTN|nr:hypothetical protein [Actinomadura coerulea]GGP92193.1 hypothetical protein GCM10010187_04530 [Actinomadura coerulea]
MLSVRLIGLPDDVVAGVARLRETFEVIEVSSPRPCRGESLRVRVYVTAHAPVPDARDAPTAK